MRPRCRRPGLIVIGSGPAGVAAAEAFRTHDEDQPVRILTDDPDPPYARPPLSKDYLRGEVDDVALHPPQWFRERSIEVVHDATLEHIDVTERRVVAGGTEYPYDTLVLACGASPTPLPVPGGESALQLRSLADAARLRRASATRAFGDSHRCRIHRLRGRGLDGAARRQCDRRGPGGAPPGTETGQRGR